MKCFECELKPVFEVTHDISTKDREKTKIALIRRFFEENDIDFGGDSARKAFDQHGLIVDRDFVSFLRKPERIHRDKMKFNNRIIMSVDNKMFVGENRDISKALHKCASRRSQLKQKLGIF